MFAFHGEQTFDELPVSKEPVSEELRWRRETSQSQFSDNEGESMWTCIRCSGRISRAKAEASVDSFGCYFICKVCSRRNTLVDVSLPAGPTLLAQAPDRKPRWVARPAILFS
ncbi:hypothetical protein P9250_12860 [Caballeronia sp. LP006]|uniref:hypothetical protein n=1 Tax=unclassified Caballeronia TaxID=2646786 RepID=UPI002027DB04|nr:MULTISPECIES: hypothetical protein [unclassified Caballeronia]MDR5775442.1 hypothetical protein [Caballeronia sp. LZ002]MDR5828772.1 hypothetical protein [Caballeronia sp. LP006]MDR5850880.1 hypothetical protein [Caballeronia sp. LZ003]